MNVILILIIATPLSFNRVVVIIVIIAILFQFPDSIDQFLTSSERQFRIISGFHFSVLVPRFHILGHTVVATKDLSSPLVDEPVGELYLCEPRLDQQVSFLLWGRVRVVQMLVEPLVQNEDTLLGQVIAAVFPGYYFEAVLFVVYLARDGFGGDYLV